jgi:hypothetical protein
MWAGPRFTKALVVIVLLASTMLIGSNAESAASKPLLQDGPTVRAAVSASSHISYPFTDDVENLSAGFWTADSPWDRTTDDSHSANTSWTEVIQFVNSHWA